MGLVLEKGGIRGDESSDGETRDLLAQVGSAVGCCVSSANNEN